MLVGQKLGPFAIDKELGAGAMGAVYLARYVKTGARVAVKVMVPGMAGEQATARFEREAKILKQFNHPNIVKMYGFGKAAGTRYYAMEYVDGESLEKVLARRGRFSWEEVVTLGQQLCAALQHAHEQGIVHRDLKPSNLMIVAGDTLKLTDFGIAKDLDLTGLTGTNCTVGTAAYMSPEQCKGDTNITHKSDLYSLGVVFYELVTGKKPFNANSPMDMFLQHVKGKFERPSRMILDLPVWLDTLISQLLEKKPEQRPRDAAMVYAVLGSIKEKVETQRSAGVEAVRTQILGGDTNSPKLDQTDKEASRLLMTGKGRTKKRKKGVPFFRRGWFVILAVACFLCSLGGLIYWISRPPSAETLYAEAAELMNTDSPENWQKARAGPINVFQGHYRSRTDEQAKQMNDWADKADKQIADEMLGKYLRKMHKNLPFPANSREEELGFKAARIEESGELEEASQVWQELQKTAGRSWALLAADRLSQLEAVKRFDQNAQDQFKYIRDFGKEPKLTDLEREALAAYRCEHFADIYMGSGDLSLAQRRWDEMKEKYREEPGQRFWYLLSASKIHSLKFRVGDLQKPDAARKELIEKAFAAAQELEKNSRLLDARFVYMQIIEIYDKEPGLKDMANKAVALLKDVNKKLAE